MAAISKAPAVVAPTLLQPILSEARLVVKIFTQGTVNSVGANEKEKVQLECAAAMHVMQNKGWETVIDECPHRGGGGQGDVLHNNSEWTYATSGGTSFSAMCVGMADTVV